MDSHTPQAFRSPFRSLGFWVTTIAATAWSVAVIVVFAIPPNYWRQSRSLTPPVQTAAEIENERHHRAVEQKLQRIGNQLYQMNEQRWMERDDYRWDR